MGVLGTFFENLNSKKAITVIIILGVVVYFNLLFSGPVVDFPDYVSENPLVQSFANWPSFFTLSSDSPFTQQILRDRLQNYYRPVMLLVISLIYSFSGSNPFFYNLVLITLHIINAVLVFLLFKHFFKTQLSLFLSSIFLVHPINLETATFIGIADLLFFFFGTWCFLAAKKDNLKAGDFLLIFVLTTLSLLSKETAIVMIFLILFFRLLFNRKNLAKLISVFLLALFLYFVLRLNFALVGDRNIDFNPILQSSFQSRLITMPAVATYYLTTFIFPRDLAVLAQWVVTDINFDQFLLPLFFTLFFLGCLTLIGAQLAKEKKGIFLSYIFFITWLVLGLAPHLQLIPLTMVVADRWFYLPIVGLLGIIGIVLKYYVKFSKNLAIYLGLMIILILSVRTFARSFDWRDNLVLYSQDIKLHPDNYNLLINLAHELFIRRQYGQAQELYERAVTIAPNGWLGWNNLGTNYYAQQNYAKAEENYLKAIKNGRYESAFSNLVILYFEQKNFLKAKEVCQEAIGIYPNNPILWRLLALSEAEVGSLDKAIEYAQKSDSLYSDQYSKKVFFDLNRRKNN